LRTIGGIGCDEEFALFLAANPNMVQIPDRAEDDPGYFYDRFLCGDGGVRWVVEKPQPCILAFYVFLRESPQYVGLNPSGLNYFTVGVGNTLSDIIFAGSIFRQFPCSDGSIWVYVDRGFFITGTSTLIEDSSFALVVPPIA